MKEGILTDDWKDLLKTREVMTPALEMITELVDEYAFL
jgi:hypothetical protein